MKHLKTFENQITKDLTMLQQKLMAPDPNYESAIYIIGDYIAIKREFFRKDIIIDTYAKIIDIDYSQVPYHLQLSDGNDIWCRPDHIDRKLNTEEIEQYELKFNANKYNL